MKLTTEIIKKMIRKELMEIYKGKNRVIRAPGPKYGSDRLPGEKGSYIVPLEDPYDELDPMVKQKIPKDAPDDLLSQGYDLSSALGAEPEDNIEDFLYGNKLSRNPDLTREEAIEILQQEYKKARAYAAGVKKSMGVRSKEYADARNRMFHFYERLNALEAGNLDKLYST